MKPAGYSDLPKPRRMLTKAELTACHDGISCAISEGQLGLSDEAAQRLLKKLVKLGAKP